MMSLPYRPTRILIRSMQGWTGLVVRSHGDLVRKQSCAQGWEFDGCWTIGVQRGACFKVVLGVVESTLGTVGWDVIICYDYLLFKFYNVTSIWSKTLWSTYDRWIEMWVGRDLIWTSSIRWATKTARPGVLHPHLSECLSEISKNHALDSESCF